MRRFPDKPRKKTRIEIIPMIDVMMFLLVFFVLISINVIPALGLKMQLPQSSQAKEEHPPKRVIIGISASGQYALDGESLSDATALLNAVRKLHSNLNAELTSKTPKLVFIINGDQESRLQQLVDVMDLLKAEGFNSITIASKRKS
jgi:biopolymer transport protein ExbD